MIGPHPLSGFPAADGIVLTQVGRGGWLVESRAPNFERPRILGAYSHAQDMLVAVAAALGATVQFPDAPPTAIADDDAGA